MQSVFAQNSYNLSFRNKTTKLGQTGYCGTLLQVQSNLLMINNAGGNGRVEVRENNAFGTLLGAITFTISPSSIDRDTTSSEGGDGDGCDDISSLPLYSGSISIGGLVYIY